MFNRFLPRTHCPFYALVPLLYLESLFSFTYQRHVRRQHRHGPTIFRSPDNKAALYDESRGTDAKCGLSTAVLNVS